MANWQRTLRLQPEWGKAKEHEIAIQELAGVIAKRLSALHAFDDEGIDGERNELAERFEAFSRDAEAERDEFDEIMNDLYDWGDQRLDDNWNGKKVCWIDWMSAPAKV